MINAPGLVMAGANPDPASELAMLNAIIANGQSSAGGVNFQASSGATITLTALGNLLQQLTVGSACTVTLDSAYNIGLQLPGAPLSASPGAALTASQFVGQQFTFTIQTNAGTTVATPTLSDTAVTLSGTTTVLAAAMRWYQGTFTQVWGNTGVSLTSGTTYTSITRVGTTNNYTIALGTNAIVPSVGQVIYIGTTAGTLPAGWYPINKVTSATSFVIAAPTAAVAWTCTAATLQSAVNPPPNTVYSPLITIKGLMATVTAIMSV